MCACGRHPKSECEDGEHSSEDDIPLKAIDDIGRATAEDVKEALHQVIDPELGIDVIDLGLVYGIEIDELGRAIITMTLTTPACPLTDLIEDECASTLAGLVEEFRIDWTWQPRWTMDKLGKKERNSVHSCAARVLLWASTSVGRLHFAITFAMVKVLPLPVTPSRVWQRSPRSTPSTSVLIACGWSPVGW